MPTNMGFANGSRHRGANDAEAPSVDALVNRFLLGKNDTVTTVW